VCVCVLCDVCVCVCDLSCLMRIVPDSAATYQPALYILCSVSLPLRFVMLFWATKFGGGFGFHTAGAIFRQNN
jgi:hypothetical protein